MSHDSTPKPAEPEAVRNLLKLNGLYRTKEFRFTSNHISCTKVIVVWNVHRQRKPKKFLFSLTEYSTLEDWVRCVDNTQYMI